MNLNVSPPGAPPGSTIAYEVSVTNGTVKDGACNVRDVRVAFCCPGPDGNPGPGPEGCTRVPVTTVPCEVNGIANCTPNADSSSLTFPADDTGDIIVPGLLCTIGVNPGVTKARAEARIDDYVLLQTEAGVLQPGFSQFVDVALFTLTPTPAGPTPTPTPSANLVVVSVDSAATATIGGQVNVSVTVENVGPGPAGQFAAYFYYSTDQDITAGDTYSGYACSFGGLGPGQSTACTGAIGVPDTLTPGSYYLGATLSYSGTASARSASQPLVLSAAATANPTNQRLHHRWLPPRQRR